jgi:transcription antitermination factor NusA-like protein
MLVKLPICESCSKAEGLCPGCEERLKSGKISEIDVKVSRLLARVAPEYSLEQADFYKAIDLGKVVLVLTRGDVGLLIGKEGKVVSEISAEVGKKVRIAEMGGNKAKTVSDIVAPVRITGINTIYRDGKEAYKVRIPRGEARHLPIDLKTLETALNRVFESQVTVEME